MDKDKNLRSKTVGLIFIIASVSVFILVMLLSFGRTNGYWKTLLPSGILIIGYFVYNLVSLRYLIKNDGIEKVSANCYDIEKTGYRKQSQKTTFLIEGTNNQEPFIYFGSKNATFKKGLRYDLYFRKGEPKNNLNIITYGIAEKQNYGEGNCND